MPAGSIEIDLESCKDCKLCMSVCPHHLIVSSDGMNNLGYYPARFIGAEGGEKEKKCTGCGLCAVSCPEIAIEVYRG